MQAKLESLGLDCDVVEDLFDVLDADGSDDVSEAELDFILLVWVGDFPNVLLFECRLRC